MEHSKQPQNGLGLLVLFLSLTLGGVVLSWIYIGLIDLIPFIYLNFLTALGFAIALGVIVKLVKTKFNISTVVGTVAIVILSLLIINFVRGQMWFAMWYSRMYFPDPDGYYFYFEPSFLNVFLDLRYFLDAIVWISRYPFENGANPIMVFVNDLRSFNYWGTWGMGYGLVTGFFLWIIWAVELAIICSMPLLQRQSQ
ncbi:MAG: hypothetical protein FWD97_08835 [Defluviitaleaceae bacterium]|nr:hypothetical protein [Defluviitaleaceae bacterium]